MHQEHFLQFWRDRANPIHEISLVRMRAQLIESRYLRSQPHRFAKDLHLWVPFDEASSQCVGRLKSGDQNDITRVFDAIPKVMEDSAAFTHPRGRNHNKRSTQII